MVTLDLSKDEAETLTSILTSTLSDLRMEIADTDRKDWRDDLKQREEFINRLLGRLAAAAA